MTNDMEIVERLTRVEAQTTNNTTDIAGLKEDTKAISKIANGIEIMAVEMKGMSENINRIDNKVSGLRQGGYINCFGSGRWTSDVDIIKSASHHFQVRTSVLCKNAREVQETINAIDKVLFLW
jgi:tRNA(Glu) U13 pseudouridine synthase TruD